MHRRDFLATAAALPAAAVPVTASLSEEVSTFLMLIMSWGEEGMPIILEWVPNSSRIIIDQLVERGYIRIVSTATRKVMLVPA